jgi:hypothetical protein
MSQTPLPQIDLHDAAFLDYRREGEDFFVSVRDWREQIASSGFTMCWQYATCFQILSITSTKPKRAIHF